MFDVKELNKKIREIGVDKIGYIVEEEDGGNEWSSCIDPNDSNAKQYFGFDLKTESFQDNITESWEGYRIDPSLFDGMFNIVFYGYGTAYQLD